MRPLEGVGKPWLFAVSLQRAKHRLSWWRSEVG